jgi:hypothetical protein
VENECNRIKNEPQFRMCNLYTITTNQAAISALFRVINRYVGNLPPMPNLRVCLDPVALPLALPKIHVNNGCEFGHWACFGHDPEAWQPHHKRPQVCFSDLPGIRSPGVAEQFEYWWKAR